MPMLHSGIDIVVVLISSVYNTMAVEAVSFLAVDISLVALEPTFVVTDIVWLSYWVMAGAPMISIDGTFDVATMMIYYFDMLAAISKTWAAASLPNH